MRRPSRDARRRGRLPRGRRPVPHRRRQGPRARFLAHPSKGPKEIEVVYCSRSEIYKRRIGICGLKDDKLTRGPTASFSLAGTPTLTLERLAANAGDNRPDEMGMEDRPGTVAAPAGMHAADSPVIA